jgi:hypothetical protein
MGFARMGSSSGMAHAGLTQPPSGDVLAPVPPVVGSLPWRSGVCFGAAVVTLDDGAALGTAAAPPAATEALGMGADAEAAGSTEALAEGALAARALAEDAALLVSESTASRSFADAIGGSTGCGLGAGSCERSTQNPPANPIPRAMPATATTLPSPLGGGGASLGSGVSAQAARRRSESVLVTAGAIAMVGAAGSGRVLLRDDTGAAV